MTLTLREFLESIDGVFRLIVRDSDGVLNFNRSAEGFWNSFLGMLIVLPIYAWSVINYPDYMRDVMAQTDETAIVRMGGGEVFLFGVQYILSWVMFPLIMAQLTEVMGVRDRYAAYITVRNWASVVFVLMFVAVPLTLYNLGFLSIEGRESFQWLALFFQLYFLWYITVLLLEVDMIQAMGVVALDIFIIVAVALATTPRLIETT